MTYTLDLITDMDVFRDDSKGIVNCIEKALIKTPEHSIGSVIASVIKGDTDLWVSRHDGEVVGIVTGKVVEYPVMKTYLIHMLGGKDIEKWIHHLDKLEAKGRELKCDSMEIQGRPAWKKMLPEYSVERIILSKRL